MKALSIKQPWAAAIATGLKTIETRTWPTKYRGPILIVASKAPDKAMLDYVLSMVNDRDKFLKHLHYGKAVAVARLVECRLMTRADEDEAMCGVYDRAHSWVLDDIRRIEPFPVKGQLGIYETNTPLVEIVGPDGKAHYRRPLWSPDIEEALKTPGYSIRYAQ